MRDTFNTQAQFDSRRIIDFAAARAVFPGVGRMPISQRILLENLLRNEDGVSVTAGDIEAVACRAPDSDSSTEIAFRPARVVMQDYAGMPALIDLAALRDKAAECGVDPSTINPQIPADLVVDHSLMVHYAGTADAFARNLGREFADNEERYAFLKWAQRAMVGLRIVPPGQGIIHQINIEYLAEIVSRRERNGMDWLLPDTVIGTDSHTTMVNGLGVLGWGVGGIEAEAVMLGEPVSMLVPPVIGVRLTGTVPPGILATDIVLTLTEALRKKGVVGSILEFFGPGVAALPVADRVTIANMSPEFGSTAAFFPTDARTIAYLDLTGRPRTHIGIVERYLRRNGLWFDPDFVPETADLVEFDLSKVQRTVSGPKRPEERRDLSEVPAAMIAAAGVGSTPGKRLADGDIVIAAITSCTNTSNPTAMVAAGLLARNARARGLAVRDTVKTSLAPGSRVVMDYLDRAGLVDDLAALGFALVGFGCTTCVGNSGELAPDIVEEIDEGDLCVASVLSGNRNFEGRIHGKIKANFLASPPMVIAYALAGSMLKDLTSEPVGCDPEGRPVMLQDIWPSAEDIDRLTGRSIERQQFTHRYATVLSGGEQWDSLSTPDGTRFAWSPESTYFQRPPFFDLDTEFLAGEPLLENGRPILILGDSVTTDHISPVGAIGQSTPAAQLLREKGVAPKDFNAYGARRGNHDVMVRGTFANARLRNEMTETVGGYTRLDDGEDISIFEASRRLIASGRPGVVIAGQMYGAGSARDWAAKGTRLLGIRCVIAESFERIHRSNLVRMGVLPLQFAPGVTRETLALTGSDTIAIATSVDVLRPLEEIDVSVARDDGSNFTFVAVARIDTLDELRYLRDGGILSSVAKRLLPAA